MNLTFASRAELRAWLTTNAAESEGVWIVFTKGAKNALTASAALEEALCFGWIDGQMESLDEKHYRKYFSRRREGSVWSEKNKKLAESLIAAGAMTEAGMAAIEAAKACGKWDAPAKPVLTEEQLAAFTEMVAAHPAACANFLKMMPSVRRTYASSYFLGTKTEAGRAKRFAAIIERLEYNLDPMASLAKAKEAAKS